METSYYFKNISPLDFSDSIPVSMTAFNLDLRQNFGDTLMLPPLNGGDSAAFVYSLNTLGGVLGSLVTGFLLLPIRGAQLSFLVVVLINLGLFGVLWWTQPTLRANPVLRREGLFTAVTVIALWLGLGPNYLRNALTAYTGNILVNNHRKDSVT